MLEPHGRSLLLESLHAPEGYHLDFALGTTYSLDLVALLAAPVAFAFSDWQDQEGRPTLEPLALLKAVRQYADRVCLFCQPGKIAVPRAYLPLLTSLEDSVVEANAPRGGSFHPKLWFLRYAAPDGSVLYRFLCLSRNMTFDRSWDTMLCLEGPLRDRVNAFSPNHPLGEFVSSLPGMAKPRELSPIWTERIKQLSHELRRVEFEVPWPFDSYTFWPLGISEKTDWPFPDRMDRVLVISPFIDDELVKDLMWHSAPMSVVSRPESLRLLTPDTIREFEKIWVLDDTAEPEAGDLDETPLGEASPHLTPDRYERAPAGEIPLVGLHAKVYVADVGWSAHVWTGSANATKAGFNRNVEFLVELRGKRKDCGTETVVGHRETGGIKQVRCLADLLRPYEQDDASNDAEVEEQAFQRSADRLARAIAAAALVARCEPVPERDVYSMNLTATSETTVTLPTGCQLRAWLISLAEGLALPVDPDRETWVRFDQVSVEGLTSFVAFELLSADGRFRQRFVLNVPLRGAPENRRERLLRLLLSDQDRVLRFLLLLLTDGGAGDFGHWFGSTPAADRTAGVAHSLFESTLFESLLRALDRDPERIDQVAQLVKDLAETAEGRELLPPGMEELLAPIRKVREQQREQ